RSTNMPSTSRTGFRCFGALLRLALPPDRRFWGMTLPCTVARVVNRKVGQQLALSCGKQCGPHRNPDDLVQSRTRTCAIRVRPASTPSASRESRIRAAPPAADQITAPGLRLDSEAQKFFKGLDRPFVSNPYTSVHLRSYA